MRLNSEPSATVLLLILIPVGLLTVSAAYGSFTFETDRLPDSSVTPTLANGHVGFVVYGNSILMNGIYNGFMGYSHRARIPNYANIQFDQCSPIRLGFNTKNCTYKLDTERSIFETVYDDGDLRITQDTYPHRFYTRAIINTIRVERLNLDMNDPISVRLYHDIGAPSEDIDFANVVQLNIQENIVFKTCGKTIDIEDSNFQPERHDVCVMYTNIPISLTMNRDENLKSVTYITTVDKLDIMAEREMEEALSNKDMLASKHAAEWTNHWARFGIAVTGNDELNEIIHASLFYLASSLPSINTNIIKHDFHGLSPSGLGRGGIELMEYQGHSFWDTEIWMHPPMLLLQPEWSKDLLNYRYNTRYAAEAHAQQTNFDGWRYPWETAFTGREVTPPCCPEVVMYQHHISADIAFAVRSHIAATHDLEWFNERGCEIAFNTAKFWESHAVFDEESGLYDIRGVMGPDEDHHNISNNAYTNVMAGYNLYFGEFASCVCRNALNLDDYTIYKKWSKIARSIKLIYNEEYNYNPQYEGYGIGTQIKQADTVLLGYPLQYPMDEETKRNNLHIYSEATRNDGPAMTWAMHVIGHLELNELNEASVMFERSYKPYIREPFNVWSEAPPGTNGVGNFITGAGGFLQSIINGYGGVRLHFDRLEITKTLVPPGTTNLTFNGITYLGSIFRIVVEFSITTVQIISLNPSIEVGIMLDNELLVVCPGCSYSMQNTQKFTIRAAKDPFGECQMPEIKIGVPYENTGARLNNFQIIVLTFFVIYCELSK